MATVFWNSHGVILVDYREQLFCRENYLDGLQRWEHRWEKCVGDYVEKLKKFSEKMSCIFVRSETFQTTLVELNVLSNSTKNSSERRKIFN